MSSLASTSCQAKSSSELYPRLGMLGGPCISDDMPRKHLAKDLPFTFASLSADEFTLRIYFISL